MNFKTHNEKDIDINGTSLCDYIRVSYANLVRVFGQPTSGDGYKVDAEWILEFDDGVVATIYNYKDGRNYCGEEGLDVEFITDWHIGGHQRADVPERVKAILDSAGAVEPKPLNFSPIEREGDFRDTFAVDGRPLENGSEIVLCWPNGNIEKTRVVLESTVLLNGNGLIDEHVTRLLVPVTVHGLETFVDLSQYRHAVTAAWIGG